MQKFQVQCECRYWRCYIHVWLQQNEMGCNWTAMAMAGVAGKRIIPRSSWTNNLSAIWPDMDCTIHPHLEVPFISLLHSVSYNRSWLVAENFGIFQPSDAAYDSSQLIHIIQFPKNIKRHFCVTKDGIAWHCSLNKCSPKGIFIQKVPLEGAA